MSRSELAFVIALIASGLGGCSAERGAPSFREARASIVGGETDTGDPAVVALQIADGECTGTLISPKVVLTAAHCTQGASAQQMQVFFGYDSYQGGVWIPVIHAEAHPTGDIAAVTLQSPGPATPIPLSSHAFVNGDQGAPVRVVGFGVTSETGQDSGLKRQAMTQVVEWDSEFVYLDGSLKDTCYGDSGGPAFMTFDGVEQVVGATSFGTAECGSDMSGETRVDVFHDWIVGYMSQHDVAPTPPPPSSPEPGCGPDGMCAPGCPTVDPDCPCANDGFCTPACQNPASDPDCPKCGADGVCRPGCPTPDPDCKNAPGTNQGESTSSPSPNAATPQSSSSSCSVGHGESPAGAWWLLLALGWTLRRRRTVSE